MRELDCCVRDMLDDIGSWDVHKLQARLSHDDLKRVISEYPPRHNGDRDQIVWGPSRDDIFFSFKSTYFTCINNGDRIPNFNLIWKLNILERVKIFLWKLAHNSLLTRDLCNRWFGGSSDCPFCLGIVETVCHALRDCHYGIVIWNDLIEPANMGNFFNNNFVTWFQSNLSNSSSVDNVITWNRCWAIAVWKIWSCVMLGFMMSTSKPPFDLLIYINTFKSMTEANRFLEILV